MKNKILIVLDNSLSVGRGNLAICRETIRYLSENAPEETELALGVIGEDLTILSDFGKGRDHLRERLYEVEITETEPSLTDVLTETIAVWKKSDLADRAIILFSDGQETEPLRHAPEELYYLLAVSDYPVYAVDCVTKEAPSAGNLSAMATISRGGLFFTEFEDSEAEVERKIGDKILRALEERYEGNSRFLSESGEAGFIEETPPAYGEGGEASEEGEMSEFEEAGGSDAAGEAFETVSETLLARAYSENEPTAQAGSLTIKEQGESMALPAALTVGLCAAVLLALLLFLFRIRAGRKRRRKRRRRVRQVPGSEETTLCLEEEVFRSGETTLLFSEAEQGVQGCGF
ncbi:MAG: VWA domain-containing protein [Lachnospiraceae bacterium]|nr:VWA domain-containing protein [Lachnospiraceae bacterium]